MGRVNYAKTEGKTAPLHSDFAHDFIERRFGPEVTAALYEAMPVFKRGKHKGKTKGWLHWTKVHKGGWQKRGPGYMNGGVVAPGAHGLYITASYDADRVLDDSWAPGYAQTDAERATATQRCLEIIAATKDADHG